MDDLFLAQGKRDIYITTAGIPDATGLIFTGTKEMFISAVSRMSAKSGAFRFVDYDPTQLDVQVLSELVGLREDFVAPNYYVRGAITQFDSSVLQSSASAGISVPNLDLAISGDQVVSIVSMDLNVGKLTTRQILAGISANNSIAVVQSGKGADIGGLIGKAGISLSVSLDKSEGFHQAVRSLVELSTIEVLGKLTHVPYWECLSIEPTNPNFRAEAREWFDAMGESERQTLRPHRADRAPAIWVQGGVGGESVGAPWRGIRPKMTWWRTVAWISTSTTGCWQAILGMPAPPRTPAVAASVRAHGGGCARAAQPTGGRQRRQTSREGAPAYAWPLRAASHPTYRAGETITLNLQPTQDAYTYCYYQDGTGNVSRIFPNRFQPDALIPARRLVHVPPTSGPFAIRFDKPRTRESFLCVAADREVGMKLPNTLKAQDLAQLPVHSLDDIAATFQEVPGARVDDARLVWR